MKTLKLASITIITMFLFLTSCDNDDELIEQQPIGNFETIDIKVILPEGSNLDLTTTEIISVGQSFEVSNSGESKILVNDGDQNFISLQNRDGGLIFMGFITEQNKELSIKSTGEATLYFALGTIFQFPEIKQKYFDEYVAQSEIETFHDALANLFLTDVNFLEKEATQSLVSETVKDLIDPKIVLDLTNKGIIVEDTQEKSGIKVTNEGPLSIAFQSRTRRRTHAFIYKTATKEEGDNAFVYELSDISGTVEPTKESPIETTDGFTSVTGSLWSVASGKGQDLFIKDTPPVSLTLTEDEIAAKYEVRVIGLNCDDSEKSKMTLKEREKYEELQLDFFIYDLILPTLGTIFGGVAEFDSTTAIIIKNSIVTTLGSGTLELIHKGKYKEAALKFIGEFTKGIISGDGLEAGLKKVVQEILKSSGLDPLDLDDVNQLKKLIRPFAVVDALLQLNDAYGRIIGSACVSNAIESWEVIATKSNVTLTPRNKILKINTSKLFEVLVEDGDLASGQSFEFEWETTGNYGEFFIGGGSGNTFTGTEKRLAYRSTITEAELSSLNEAVDSVFVKAYIIDGNNRSLIGEDKTSIKIVNDSYKIIPNEVKIQGGTELALSVVDFENKPIVAPPGQKLRILWSTPGKHGSFGGITNSYSSGDGYILYNKAPYECLDFETEQGVENISAKIYFENNGEVRLEDEIEATINIDNNENTIEFNVNASWWIKTQSPEGEGLRTALRAGFIIPYVKDAISYQIEILNYGFTLGGATGMNQIGRTYSWTNNSQSTPIGSYFYVGPTGQTEASDDYSAALSGASININSSDPDHDTIDLYGSVYGTAKVRIVLDN